MSIGLIETQALVAFNGTLEALKLTPEEKVRLVMLYVYDICKTEAWGISTEQFLKKSAAIHKVLADRDERAEDFKRREQELAKKGYPGHPKEAAK